MKQPVARRRFIQAAAGASLLASDAPAPAAARASSRDYLKELGVKPIINAAGAYTMMTGSLMRPEVVEAIQATSKQFVRLVDLSEAVGARIAAMVGAPAAMVTSGAAAALTLGTAAVLTGGKPENILAIPDLTNMKSEVIVQKTHRFPYDHMIRNCGIRMVEVETREQLHAAINPKTALLLFLNKSNNLGQIKMQEFVEIARKAGLPTMMDAAADVPPVENLLTPIKLGFDLIAVSGGKGIRGPQSAGILFGRADLIKAARLNTLPYSDTMGRSLKVNKEEMVGMMVALDVFLKEDHAALDREWTKRMNTIKAAITHIPGVTAEIFIPEIANQVPHLRVKWDPAHISIGYQNFLQKLRDGEPSIELVPDPDADELEISSWMLQPGEAEIIAARMKALLESSKAG